MPSDVVADTVEDLQTLPEQAREEIALELLAGLYDESPAQVMHLTHKTPRVSGTLYVVICDEATAPKLAALIVDRQQSLSQRVVNSFTRR